VEDYSADTQVVGRDVQRVPVAVGRLKYRTLRRGCGWVSECATWPKGALLLKKAEIYINSYIDIFPHIPHKQDKLNFQIYFLYFVYVLRISRN